jgi:serine/threonine protein kinase
MSPEQAAGQTNVVGPASDVYALGALLYHLLTGRPPFDGPDAAAVIRQVREDEPPAPRSLEASIPRALEGICLRCLQKAACARWASARDLARELHQFVSSRPKDAADARFSPGLESQLDVGACRTLHGRRRSLFLAGLLR